MDQKYGRGWHFGVGGIDDFVNFYYHSMKFTSGSSGSLHSLHTLYTQIKHSAACHFSLRA